MRLFVQKFRSECSRMGLWLRADSQSWVSILAVQRTWLLDTLEAADFVPILSACYQFCRYRYPLST